jgi:hypothetical protein
MKTLDENPPQTWYVKHEGRMAGSLTEARIRQLLLEGELGLSDEISMDNESWQHILSVPSVVPLQLRADSGDKEALAKIAAREKVRANDRAESRQLPVVPLTVSLLVVGFVLLVSLLIGMPGVSDTPQCDAPPAPGVNWRNCLLSGVDVGSASLAGANLNSSVLREAKLSATDLTAADLGYADLQQADLRYAQLNGAILLGANLQNADLRDADLSQADLRFADLTGSRLSDALLQGARMDKAIWIDGKTCGNASIGVCKPE